MERAVGRSYYLLPTTYSLTRQMRIAIAVLTLLVLSAGPSLADAGAPPQSASATVTLSISDFVSIAATQNATIQAVAGTVAATSPATFTIISNQGGMQISGSPLSFTPALPAGVSVNVGASTLTGDTSASYDDASGLAASGGSGVESINQGTTYVSVSFEATGVDKKSAAGTYSAVYTLTVAKAPQKGS